MFLLDINSVIGLGICVSVKHAQFMADRSTTAGIPSFREGGEYFSDRKIDAFFIN